MNYVLLIGFVTLQWPHCDMLKKFQYTYYVFAYTNNAQCFVLGLCMYTSCVVSTLRGNFNMVVEFTDLWKQPGVVVSLNALCWCSNSVSFQTYPGILSCKST